MRCLVSFLDFLAAGGRAFADLTLAELTDYLFAVQTGQEEDRSSNQTCPRTMLKALSWLQKVAQLEPLRPLLHNPVVMAFHSDSKPTDRREATSGHRRLGGSSLQPILQRKPSPIPRRPSSRHTFQLALRRPAEDHPRVAEPRPRLPPWVLLVYQDIYPGTTLCHHGLRHRRPQPRKRLAYPLAPGRSLMPLPINPDLRRKPCPGLHPACLQPCAATCGPALQRTSSTATPWQASAGPPKPRGCPRPASPLTRPVTSRYTVSKSPSSPPPFSCAFPKRTAGSKAIIKSTVSAFIAGTTPTNLCGSNASWRRQLEMAGALPAQSPEGDNTPWPSPAFRSHPCQSPPPLSSPKRLHQSLDSSIIGRLFSKRQSGRSTRRPRQRNRHRKTTSQPS